MTTTMSLTWIFYNGILSLNPASKVLIITVTYMTYVVGCHRVNQSLVYLKGHYMESFSESLDGLEYACNIHEQSILYLSPRECSQEAKLEVW